MINIENDVYTTVVEAVEASFPTICATSQYADTVPSFPALMFYQADSSIYTRVSTTNIENADEVMFAAYAYSNREGYGKEEANQIMNIVDETMARIGFTRITRAPVSNYADATIFQIAARYRAVVDKDLWIYQS